MSRHGRGWVTLCLTAILAVSETSAQPELERLRQLDLKVDETTTHFEFELIAKATAGDASDCGRLTFQRVGDSARLLWRNRAGYPYACFASWPAGFDGMFFVGGEEGRIVGLPGIHFQVDFCATRPLGDFLRVGKQGPNTLDVDFLRTIDEYLKGSTPIDGLPASPHRIVRRSAKGGTLTIELADELERELTGFPISSIVSQGQGGEFVVLRGFRRNRDPVRSLLLFSNADWHEQTSSADLDQDGIKELGRRLMAATYFGPPDQMDGPATRRVGALLMESMRNNLRLEPGQRRMVSVWMDVARDDSSPAGQVHALNELDALVSSVVVPRIQAIRRKADYFAWPAYRRELTADVLETAFLPELTNEFYAWAWEVSGDAETDPRVRWRVLDLLGVVGLPYSSDWLTRYRSRLAEELNLSVRAVLASMLVRCGAATEEELQIVVDASRDESLEPHVRLVCLETALIRGGAERLTDAELVSFVQLAGSSLDLRGKWLTFRLAHALAESSGGRQAMRLHLQRGGRASEEDLLWAAMIFALGRRYRDRGEPSEVGEQTAFVAEMRSLARRETEEGLVRRAGLRWGALGDDADDYIEEQLIAARQIVARLEGPVEALADARQVRPAFVEVISEVAYNERYAALRSHAAFGFRNLAGLPGVGDHSDALCEAARRLLRDPQGKTRTHTLDGLRRLAERSIPIDQLTAEAVVRTDQRDPLILNRWLATLTLSKIDGDPTGTVYPLDPWGEVDGLESVREWWRSHQAELLAALLAHRKAQAD